jgi:hypothetical protein
MRKLNFSMIIIGLLAFFYCLIFSGCHMDIEPYNNTNDLIQPIVELDLGAEGSIQFYEVDSEEILVTGLFNSKETALDLDGKNSLEVYEYFTGDEAPDVLQQAYADVQAAMMTDTNTTGGNMDVIPPQNNDTRMSGSEFQSRYCPFGANFDFIYCWVNCTNDYTIQLKVHDMYNRIHADNGSIGAYHKYYKWPRWRTVVNTTLLQGQTLWTYSSGIRRSRKTRVYNGSGDNWHLAVTGYE